MISQKQMIEVLSLRASGLVKRWHTITTHREQTVAEHSAQALSLLLLLHPAPTMTLVKAVLWHDSSERECGDVPSPVRRKNKTLADAYLGAERAFAVENHPSACFDLSDEEHKWLSAVDVLELWLHCRDELFLGNLHFEVIRDRAQGWLMKCGVEEVIAFVRMTCEGGYRSFA